MGSGGSRGEPKGLGGPPCGSGGDGRPSEVQDRSGDPPKGPGGVGRPTQKYERGQEALNEVREGSVGPAEGPGKGREALVVSREGYRCPCRSPGGVWRPSRRFGRGLDALLEVRKRLGDHFECPRGVGSLSRRSRSPSRWFGRCQRDFAKVCEGLEDSPRGPK